jgi:nucleoid-associated protein YgaU
MGLIAFIRGAGEKLFGKEVKAAESDPAVQADPARVAEANRAAATAIENHLAGFSFPVTALTVTFDVATGTARVYGVAQDQATREKVVLAAGNVEGVVQVDDQMSVQVASAPPAQYYTVVSGDNLSKISKQYYGNPNLYNKIFEANQPMLKHPDKIYPGQVLRIPPQ